MNMIANQTLTHDRRFSGTIAAASQGVVAIVTDSKACIEKLAPVFEFLELRMEVVSSAEELTAVLRETNLMAIITDVEAEDQDGFHAMKLVAGYDRDLPIMLLTDGDPVLMGAADAVQDLWGLKSVTRTSGFPVAGQLVAFLFNAGRRSGGTRLVPIC